MSDFVPDEFLTLSDAVDYAGRRLFQPDWTGREIRQLRRPPPKRTLRRLERAIGELRNLMASKHVQPIALANNGERFQVPISVWLSTDGRTVFNTGILPPGNLRESLRAKQEGTLVRRILVPKLDLDNALSFGRIKTKTEATAEAPVDEYRTGLPGRPSKSKHLIEQEFRRRCEAGEACSTLPAEARALRQWAEEKHPRAPTPTEKTITNNIRDSYNQHAARNTAQN